MAVAVDHRDEIALQLRGDRVAEGRQNLGTEQTDRALCALVGPWRPLYGVGELLLPGAP